MSCDNTLCVNTGTGRVGIGTTIPGTKLDVSGNIRATGDICTTLGGGRCLSQAVVQCTDSDGGVNYLVRGTASKPPSLFTDWCSGSWDNGLVEYYCDAL